MGIPITTVDAFTNAPFSGNPAAVCVLTGSVSDEWMQKVAAEMNLSETAFLLPQPRHADSKRLPESSQGNLSPADRIANDRPGTQLVYNLRWFTPVREVELCGHATLASAHVLWERGDVAESDTIRFETLSGPLSACRSGGWIELDFPARPATVATPPAGLLEALGAPATFVGRSQLDYLVEIESPQVLREMRPDMNRIASIAEARGVIVTSRSDQAGFEFLSRFFVPAYGIPEDPVTGSAHCTLAPYWGAKLGRTAMIGYQASRRGGAVRVTLEGDRVHLGGQAVTVLRGVIET